jgi:hypothetical protein
MNTFKVLLFVFCFATSVNAQTGIGTSTPDASAKLEVSSNNKGFLPPRISLTSITDTNTIQSPATGLLIYCKGDAGLSAGYYFWNGSAWARLTVPTDNANNVTGVVAVANGGTGVTTATGSGNTVLSNSPTFETPTISSGSGQYPSSLIINPTTHATSKRAGIWMGNWGLLQDFNGDGTKNFTITQNFSGTYPTRFFINSNGNVGIGNSAPTETLEVNGNIKATNFIGTASSALSAPTNINYGVIDVPQNVSVGPGFVDLANSPLPSAGTYKITYVVRASISTNATLAVLLLKNGTNNQVSGTEAMAIYNSSNVQVTCTQVCFVTIVAAETYKLSAWVQSGAGNMQVINDGNGRSKVVWEKIQ